MKQNPAAVQFPFTTAGCCTVWNTASGLTTANDHVRIENMTNYRGERLRMRGRAGVGFNQTYMVAPNTELHRLSPPKANARTAGSPLLHKNQSSIPYLDPKPKTPTGAYKISTVQAQNNLSLSPLVFRFSNSSLWRISSGLTC